MSDYEKFSNVITMLKRRGDDVSHFENILKDFGLYFQNMISAPENYTIIYQILQSKTDKKNTISSGHAMSFLYKDRNNLITLVFFTHSVKSVLGDQIETLQKILFELEKNYPVQNIIIVAQHNLHFKAKSILSISENSYFIQFFLNIEISSDPTDYTFGSTKIEVFDEKQTAEFFLSNKLTPNMVPCIPISDIIPKYLGVKKGVIIKTTDKSLIPDVINKEYVDFSFTYEKSTDTVKPKINKKSK